MSHPKYPSLELSLLNFSIFCIMTLKSFILGSQILWDSPRKEHCQQHLNCTFRAENQVTFTATLISWQ